MKEIGIALGTVVATALALWLWSGFTKGGLIRALGGATADQVFALSDVEFCLEDRSVTQDEEQRAGGPDAIANSVNCPSGWEPGPVISETYVQAGTARRKYTRLCLRIQPDRTAPPRNRQSCRPPAR